MATDLEDLKVLQAAEGIADAIWKRVVQRDEFSKDVVGKQMLRATDPIGANIAESCGRFNYGEKLQFLYYSRGSLFETKYWLNRARIRRLLDEEEVNQYASRLTDVARQLDTFASRLKMQRKEAKSQTVREPKAEYLVDVWDDETIVLFTDSKVDWLVS